MARPVAALVEALRRLRVSAPGAEKALEDARRGYLARRAGAYRPALSA